MRRKKPTKKVIIQTILGILQSTVFLTTHAYGFSTVLCTLRRLVGHFDKYSVAFTPAFLSSLVAIHLERPSRRPILCLYVTNVVSIHKFYNFESSKGQSTYFATFSRIDPTLNLKRYQHSRYFSGNRNLIPNGSLERLGKTY